MQLQCASVKQVLSVLWAVYKNLFCIFNKYNYLINMHKLGVLEESSGWKACLGRFFLPTFQAIEYVEPLGP